MLIVKFNKLILIISRRNRHVPAGDFARHSLWYPWKGYAHRWCEGITWQKNVCNDDWDDDSFLTKRSIRTIRVFLVCCARGPGFRVGGKIVFLADLARFCLCIVYKTLFCEKRDFGRLRSCSYSRERARSYLRFPKGKALPFENARECTSGRHVGAFYWVNMHQIMRDILRGALMESLILENASFVEKMKI